MSIAWIACLPKSSSRTCCCCCGGGGGCGGGCSCGGGGCSIETTLTICLTDWPKEEISCDCAVFACWEVDRGLKTYFQNWKHLGDDQIWHDYLHQNNLLIEGLTWERL